MSASGAKWSIEYYSLRVIEKAITLDSTLAAQGVRHCNFFLGLHSLITTTLAAR